MSGYTQYRENLLPKSFWFVEPLDMEAMDAEDRMYTGLHSLTEAVI